MDIYRVCTKCRTSQPISHYHKNKRAKGGLQLHCKTCIFKAQRIRRDRDPDAPLHSRDKRVLKGTTWRQRNPEYYLAKSAERKANIVNATPKWLTNEHRIEIIAIYKEAKEKGMHVDHDIPLRGKTVCGLHVPWNLKLLPPIENIKKSNKLLT